MTSGIYYIVNRIDRKRYIGFSKNIEERYSKIEQADWALHPNTKLANAVKKHGNENFRFIIAEECSEEMLSKREIYHCHMFPNKMLYNIAEPGLGGNLVDEVNAKISTSCKIAQNKPEVKAKNSAAQKIFQNRPDIKAAKIARQTGKKASQEAKNNMSAAQNRLEVKAKQSAAKVGKKASQKTKDKMSKTRTGKKHSQEAKDKISAANSIRKVSQQTRDKMSATHTGKKLSQETKDKMRAAKQAKIIAKAV
ncbi:MAG: NUMOD3 domain-containing DNA-binding protein [Nanoarchaeota archaeon]